MYAAQTLSNSDLSSSTLAFAFSSSRPTKEATRSGWAPPPPAGVSARRRAAEALARAALPAASTEASWAVWCGVVL